MFRNQTLKELMAAELPAINRQKKLCYRTNYDEAVAIYRMLNKEIFNNQLEMPIIEVMPRCRKYWGMCFGYYERVQGRRSYCKIRLMDKWYCRQWLITTLAHEMCHQYQWDIIGTKREAEGKFRLMSHGSSFFVFKEKLAKHGISLKRAHGRRRWFKHQDFWKC
jgi:hypothetical protein